MKFTLRQLDVFLHVAKEQSISKAAQALSMSQSATSAAIQELENRYDIQLFERSAKRLRLNPLGKAMRAKAEVLVAHAQSFENELLQHEDHGEVRVGASLTIGNYLAFDYVAKYLQAHPNTKVNIDVGNTPETVNKVLNFEVDIGLIEAELHHEELCSELWLADKMIAFCSPTYSLADATPLASKTHLTDKDLLNCEWILREPDSGHRQTFDRAMQGLLPKLKIRAELRQNEAIKNAVKSGLGVGCLSEIALQDEISAGVIVPLLIPKRKMNRHFYIVRRIDAPASKAVDRWLKTCQKD